MSMSKYDKRRNRHRDMPRFLIPFDASIDLQVGTVRWTPKTGQVAKRESPLGAAGWPEVRVVEYSEETQS